MMLKKKEKKDCQVFKEPYNFSCVLRVLLYETPIAFNYMHYYSKKFSSNWWKI